MLIEKYLEEVATNFPNSVYVSKDGVRSTISTFEDLDRRLSGELGKGHKLEVTEGEHHITVHTGIDMFKLMDSFGTTGD